VATEGGGWWRSVRRGLLKLVLVSLPTLVVAALLFELAARTVLPASDVPDTRFEARLGNHFVGDQAGTYVKGATSEIRARFRINGDGWNSPYEYGAERPARPVRVAVIGDSFIEAIQVDFDDSYPYLAERQLDDAVEIFTYGHSGANLVHYLAVLEHALEHHAPDVVVLNLVPNDYTEALTGYARKDNWSLRPVANGYELVAPRPVKNLSWKRAVRRSAAARYLIVNLDLVAKLSVVRRLFYADTREAVANVDDADLAVLADPAVREELIAWVLDRALAATGAAGVSLGLVVAGDPRPIYAGQPASSSPVRRLAVTTLEAAAARGVPALDLDPVLRAAWDRDGQPFEWRSDGHWNTYAHQVIADAAATWLRAWAVESVVVDD